VPTVDELRARRDLLSIQIGERKAAGASAEELIVESRALKAQIKALEAEQQATGIAPLCHRESHSRVHVLDTVEPEVPMVDELRARRDLLSIQIGERKAAGESATELIAESRALSAQIKALGAEQQAAEAALLPDHRSRLRVDVLDSVAQVQELQDEWRGLLARSAVDSPFMSWEYMVSWYEAYAEDGQVQCLTVRDGDGQLVGLVPLFVNWSRRARVPRGQVALAASYGPSRGGYLEPIAAPGHQTAIVEVLVQYLQKRPERLRGGCFWRTPVESEICWELGCSLMAAGWQMVLRPDDPVPVLRLPEDPEQIVEALSSKQLRTNCRSFARRLEAEYPSHGYRECTDAGELPYWLQTHASLNVSRRKGTNSPSTFLESRNLRCFPNVMRRLWEAGWLRLLGLEINGELVGTYLYIVYRTRAYLLGPAWDPRLARYGLGHLLLVAALRASSQEGVQQADFLSGGSDYKSLYKDDHRQVMDLSVRPKAGRSAHVCGEFVERKLTSALHLIRRSSQKHRLA
jgi:CelD/BcsL family acetyltransferase involved in cellulose biosynthesis